MDNMDNQQQEQSAATPVKKKTGNFLFALICVVIAAALVICAYSIMFKLCFTDAGFKNITMKTFKYRMSKDLKIGGAHLSPDLKFKYKDISFGDIKAEAVSGQFSLFRFGMGRYSFKEIRVDNAEIFVSYNSSKIDGKKIKAELARAIKINKFSAKKIIVKNSRVYLKLKDSEIKFTGINAQVCLAKNIYKGSASFTAVSGKTSFASTVNFEYNVKTGSLKILKISDENKAPAFFKKLVAAIKA